MRKIKLLAPFALVLFSFTKTAVTPPQDSFCGIKNIAFNVKEGDVVLYGKYAGQEINHQGLLQCSR